MIVLRVGHFQRVLRILRFDSTSGRNWLGAACGSLASEARGGHRHQTRVSAGRLLGFPAGASFTASQSAGACLRSRHPNSRNSRNPCQAPETGDTGSLRMHPGQLETEGVNRVQFTPECVREIRVIRENGHSDRISRILRILRTGSESLNGGGGERTGSEIGQDR
jgi:hypothetical protein